MNKPRSSSSHIDPSEKCVFDQDILHAVGSACYDYPYCEQNVKLHNTTERHFLRISSIGVNDGKLIVDSLLTADTKTVLKVLVCSLLFVDICATQEDMRTEVLERIGNWESIYNWLATIGVASAAIDLMSKYAYNDYKTRLHHPTIVSIRQSQSVVEVVLHELTLGIDHGVIFGKRRVGDAATYYNYARKLAFLLVLHEVNRIANAYQELDIAEEEWLNHEDIDSWEETRVAEDEAIALRPAHKKLLEDGWTFQRARAPLPVAVIKHKAPKLAY